MAINAYKTYQNNAVNTATGSELTLMLYNGCIKFIKQSKKELEAGNFEDKNKCIQKAQNIIQELMLTLDQKVEISKQMIPLYEYMHYRLTQANLKNDCEMLDEVLGFAIEFRDTWKQVIQKNRQKEFAQGAQI
ncbi:flagellar export chaperone FliS [Virgibacillus sp. 179-BFC.A HS]|uniref:Flagellar secretion chaperone FliS n=1 Tax=Tigheibacillus jepli TaxID=3035914 RepID=A0ABU5CFI6_9BACI|nr:flagellar export chaperone FliS [Virgibacillus sp. 179-BFC.A HS]MDY0405096.1 flagellar export chaperone FliS [Virgibacillus sp. 179-BFC.A HS]